MTQAFKGPQLLNNLALAALLAASREVRQALSTGLHEFLSKWTKTTVFVLSHVETLTRRNLN